MLWVFQMYFKGISKESTFMFSESSKVVLRKIQSRFKEGWIVLSAAKVNSRVFQGSFKAVSRKFQVYFKCVSRESGGWYNWFSYVSRLIPGNSKWFSKLFEKSCFVIYGSFKNFTVICKVVSYKSFKVVSRNFKGFHVVLGKLLGYFLRKFQVLIKEVSTGCLKKSTDFCFAYFSASKTP